LVGDKSVRRKMEISAMLTPCFGDTDPLLFFLSKNAFD